MGRCELSASQWRRIEGFQRHYNRVHSILLLTIDDIRIREHRILANILLR